MMLSRSGFLAAARTRVVVLCRRFDGRRVRTIFHRAEAFVRSLDESEFGANDWWKSRSGFKSFFKNGLSPASG